MCEECNSVWLSPDDVGSSIPDAPQAPDFKLHNSSVSIVGKGADWASYDEAVNYGFGNYVSAQRNYKP